MVLVRNRQSGVGRQVKRFGEAGPQKKRCRLSGLDLEQHDQFDAILRGRSYCEATSQASPGRSGGSV